MTASSRVIDGLDLRRILIGLFVVIVFICITPFLPFENEDMANFFLSALVLNTIVVLMLVRHHDLMDPTTTFLLYYAMHYSIMMPLYGSGIVWNHMTNLIEGNWPLVTTGNVCAAVGLGCYALGTFVAAARRQNATSLNENIRSFPSPEFCNLLYKLFIILGLSAWFLVFIQSSSPIDTLMGKPLDRRGMQQGLETLGGGWLHIFITSFAHAFLLFCLANPKRSLVSIPNFIMLSVALYFNLIKGARLDLIIIPFSAYVLYRQLGDGRIVSAETKQTASRIIRKLAGGVLFVAFILGTVIYTAYRNDMPLDSFMQVGDFFHSLADSSGFLALLDKVPAEIDYWYGKTYLHPFVIYIPSFIFPNKYSYMFCVSEFTELFYGWDIHHDFTTTSNTYTLLGEFFINFGWYGVVMLMGLFGYFNQRMYQLAKSQKGSLLFKYSFAFYVAAFIPYAVKAGLVAGIEYHFQMVALIFLIPIWMLRKLIYRR